MNSISRSILLAAAAGLLALPVSAMAQQLDTATGGAAAKSAMSNTTGHTKQANASATGGSAMKSVTPGYEGKSAVSDGSKAPGNAATGQPAKQSQ